MRWMISILLAVLLASPSWAAWTDSVVMPGECATEDLSADVTGAKLEVRGAWTFQWNSNIADTTTANTVALWVCTTATFSVNTCNRRDYFDAGGALQTEYDGSQGKDLYRHGAGRFLFIDVVTYTSGTGRAMVCAY